MSRGSKKTQDGVLWFALPNFAQAYLLEALKQVNRACIPYGYSKKNKDVMDHGEVTLTDMGEFPVVIPAPLCKLFHYPLKGGVRSEVFQSDKRHDEAGMSITVLPQYIPTLHSRQLLLAK